MNEKVMQLRPSSYSEKLGNYIKELQEENEKLKKELEIEINSSNIKSAQIKDKDIKIEKLKEKINKVEEMIKGTQFYGMRNGKTLLSKYLNELLVALGDKQ